MSRFVRPETCRLLLASGESLTVKKRLTHGEQRAAYARMSVAGPDGRRIVDTLQHGMALVTAYLVDWHLLDDDVSIRGNWPLRTNENCHGCFTVAHQLGGYRPDAARFMTTRATAS